jgi:hypothetical protein
MGMGEGGQTHSGMKKNNGRALVIVIKESGSKNAQLC